MRSLPLLLPIAALLAGCMTTPKAGDLSVAEADRWEKTNRKIYAFNRVVDRYALKPAGDAFRAVTPPPLRNGIANAYSNYGEGLNFTNAVAQGKIKQAFRTLDRVLINTTIGVGGLADHASDLGRPQEPEDFGQTLAWYGVPSGPYLMLPIFGPSTLRDGVGFAVDTFVNPSDYGRNAIQRPPLGYRLGQTGLQLVSLRSRATEQGADALLKDSLDPYTLIKSAYLQRRKSLIWDGNPPLGDDEFDLPAEDGAAPPADPNAAPDAGALGRSFRTPPPAAQAPSPQPPAPPQPPK
ncbi:hypothetical protein IP88_01680 [alpha proteobacterium AAP81b]|nr:hypothetical protein IP88_01680 [alpha proteobacterium AAP81b]